MSFSLEQVLAYKTVVDAGGIKQAARVLGKHASTLREQVTNFELDTGLELACTGMSLLFSDCGSASDI